MTEDLTRAICEMQMDIGFLLRRAMKAGTCSFTSDRDTGLSSNSIVAIAYGLIPLSQQTLPMDRSDWLACLRTWEAIPPHRKTKDAMEAILAAEHAVKENP
jgi:hypothetical protein